MDETLAASLSKKTSAEKGDGVCRPRLPDRRPRRSLKVVDSFLIRFSRMAVDDGLPVLLFSSPIERMHIADEAYPVGPVTRGLACKSSTDTEPSVYRALHSASNHGDKGSNGLEGL